VESVEVPGFDRSKFQLASPRDDKAITDSGVHVGQIDGAKYVIQRTDGSEVPYTPTEYPIVRARSKRNHGQRRTLWGIPRGPTPRFFNNPMDYSKLRHVWEKTVSSRVEIRLHIR
jgi:hypothetical protein